MGGKSSKLSQEQLSTLTKTTRFTEKELQQWHRGFIKDCPKGSLQKQDFLRIYKDYFPFGDSSKYAHYIFSHIDVDKNGVLDFEEFIKSIDISARGTIEERLKWSFKLFDLDEDGYISQAEMLAIVDSIYRMVGQTNDLPDDEKTPTDRVEKVFRLMDLDQDGLLSLQEFVNGGQLDPTILNSLNLYSGLI
ncbi:hypothetical protein BC833DRAFT_607457 [Globomyces pollinis-pini]|nr:hypothetical protein BC833DRAFT_607457 [Globomyces pollinis-pini]